MIYNKPIVEKRSTAEFFSRRLKPKGPIRTPDIISPIIPGIFNLFNRIGERRMINKINENSRTGLVRGKLKSSEKFLKKSVMSY
jgi:hypothetical protein